MSEPRSPHFLRVVKALAFVTGIAPAVGGGVAACSSSGEIARAHDDTDAGPTGSSGVVAYPEPYDGQVAGIVVEPYDGQVLGVVDAGIVQFLPDGAAPYYDAELGDDDAEVPPDAEVDARTINVGGPLPPPELPA